MSKKIVFFDFDNTITKRDTLPTFLKYLYPLPIFLFKSLIFLPFYVLFKLRLISNNLAKKILVFIFFKELKIEYFEEKVRKFTLEILPKLIKPKSLELINKYKKENYQIVIVTANFEQILYLWAKNNQLELIGTQLEIKGNKFTGKLASKNCRDYEKVNRIKQKFNLNKLIKSFIPLSKSLISIVVSKLNLK
ncbi:MAG: HAD family hydrolase [bacterium]